VALRPRRDALDGWNLEDEGDRAMVRLHVVAGPRNQTIQRASDQGANRFVGPARSLLRRARLLPPAATPAALCFLAWNPR
jgi:hypothetical protein